MMIGVGDASSIVAPSGKAASHDHLFHTLLALTDVQTALYDPDWDLIHDCRRATLAPAR